MASHLGSLDPTGHIFVTDCDGAMVVHCPARLPETLCRLLTRLDERSALIAQRCLPLGEVTVES